MGLLKMLGLAKEPPPRITNLLQQVSKRAERLDPHQQAGTFVSIGGVESTLLNIDNRVIFGRRGTGKTHLLFYVAEAAKKRGEIAVLMDIRTLGSNSYIYNDESLSIPDRATRLLRDFVTGLHERLFDQVTEPDSHLNVTRLAPLIDAIGGAVKEVLVRESVERKQVDEGSSETKVGAEASAKASSLFPTLDLKGRTEHSHSGGSSIETTEKSSLRVSVNIGHIHRAFSQFADATNSRIWVLIDEWSVLPETLQPYLADFIKRTLFPIPNFSVQIAAIEQRSHFRVGSGTSTFGIELGSDASADINLDDYLVADNNPQRSMSFFKELLFRHLVALDPRLPVTVPTSDAFVASTFTQGPAFRELVRACEGVPRDIINIIQLAATRAAEGKISVPHVREAAKDWYDRDKASYVNSNPEADELLQWIMGRVIEERKSKAFLVRSDVQNVILERLFDERILHVAKKSYSTKQDPGVRYRVFKLDYGCYVDLINTSRAPTGFLFENIDPDGESIAVPEDDFRAIRRVILDLDAFNNRHAVAPPA
jgi:hypothetical protein